MRYLKLTRSDAEKNELPRVVAYSDNVNIGGKTLTIEEISREEAEASIKDDTVETDESVYSSIAAREAALAAMLSFGQDVRKQVVGGADSTTRDLWIMKAIRAERYLSGNATERDVALLTLETQVRNRGESIDELAAKIDANSIHLQTAGVITEAMEKSSGDILKKVDADKLDITMQNIMAQAGTELQKISSGLQLDNSDKIKEKISDLEQKVKI